MRITVLGAAGRTGRHVVRLAAEQGHEIVAVARRPLELPAGARQVTGDVTDASVVEQAVRGIGPGQGAVVSCLGVTKGSTGLPSARAAQAVIRAVPAGTRYVGVAGAGLDVPGDRKGRGARVASALTRRLAGRVFADKVEEHRALAASGLAWTLVRPPRLSDGDAAGPARLSDDAPGLTDPALPRAALAAAVLRLAVEGGHEGRAPFAAPR